GPAKASSRRHHSPPAAGTATVAFTSAKLLSLLESVRQPPGPFRAVGTDSAVRLGAFASILDMMAENSLYCNSFATASSGSPNRLIGKRVGLAAVTPEDDPNPKTRICAMPNTSAIQLPPTFNRLAWSNLAAQSAEQIALAAAPIVAVLMLGVGEGQTGLLQTALTLPFILIAIPAGLAADRMSRRFLMAGSEALLAVALAAILLLIWFGALNLPLLALLGF